MTDNRPCTREDLHAALSDMRREVLLQIDTQAAALYRRVDELGPRLTALEQRAAGTAAVQIEHESELDRLRDRLHVHAGLIQNGQTRQEALPGQIKAVLGEKSSFGDGTAVTVGLVKHFWWLALLAGGVVFWAFKTGVLHP